MDNPTIEEPREPVPDWARSMAPPGAPEGMSGPKITDKQRGFLLDLIGKKFVKPDQGGKLDLVMKCLRISEDPEEYGMSKAKASELIEWFLKQPNKPKEQQHTSVGHLMALPAGRYAIENKEGELRFYKKWVSQDKTRFSLYVIHGPYESKLPRLAQEAIATKILLAGVRECAIRYGMEIGECSNCGRRLTNRISRELGIGPICGGRMFGDDGWKDEVKSKRQEIKARGQDPDEELAKEDAKW